MSTLRSALFTLVIAAACDRPPQSSPRGSEATAAVSSTAPPSAGTDSGSVLPSFRPSVSGGVVDSILPIDEEIRRFREASGKPPEALMGGARSRDALIRTWVTAVERLDTLALARMLMNAGEYIAFYYPESPYTRPPYRQSPAIRWLLIQNTNDQGITRVLRRHGGHPLGFRGYACAPAPEVLGRNRIWTDCVIRFVEEGRDVERRLFGSILERDGRFKFLTYASDY